jgi:hypothetical protein
MTGAVHIISVIAKDRPTAKDDWVARNWWILFDRGKKCGDNVTEKSVLNYGSKEMNATIRGCD